METWVLAPVLLAAVLHAGWNLLVKMRGDKLVMMGVIDAGHGLLSLPLLLFFPFPHAAAWPFIFASALLHVGYKLFLVRAYHHADQKLDEWLGSHREAFRARVVANRLD